MKLAELGRPARVLLTGSAFVFFWSGGALLSFVILPLVGLRPRPEPEKRREYQGWVKWGFTVFHDYMRLLGLTDYDPRKVELPVPDGPYVMISNHPTLVAVTAIMSVVGELAVVAKRSYWRGEVRRMLAACGHIQGGDDEAGGEPLVAASVAVQALERLAAGRPVLIFPEGTRSPERGLHPFQRGAFEIARRAGVPLVPVFITAEPPWLMKHQRWFHVPDRMNQMRVRLLEGAAIEVPNASASARELAARYQERYQAVLDRGLRKEHRSGMVRD